MPKVKAKEPTIGVDLAKTPDKTIVLKKYGRRVLVKSSLLDNIGIQAKLNESMADYGRAVMEAATIALNDHVNCRCTIVEPWPPEVKRVTRFWG